MKYLGLVLVVSFLSMSLFAQSNRQDFPTPIVRDEINGAIAARDIGDSRQTQHFYTFYANAGDLFLEIETANLNGDVDIFEATSLRPLSKISLYADNTPTTTSRIIYFRKRERVVLRVEGRTPNDDAARYRIKFSGSFVAAADLPAPPEDFEPKVSAPTSSEAVAKVNSAGAIIEIIAPKKTEPEAPQVEPETEATTKDAEEKVAEKPARSNRTSTAATASRRNPPRRRAATTPRRTLPTPAENDESASAETPETVKPETSSTTARRRTAATSPPRRRTPSTRRAPTRNTTPKTTETTETAPDPLASVRFVVLLKDGYKIERPMSEILRVNVDKGQLVVIAKDGKIERFALLDVQKMSIEQ
jgi:hypothetical protein